MRKQLGKIALTAGIALATAFTFSCSSDDGDDNNGGSSSPSGGGGDIEYGSLSYQGKTYKTVKIGEQTWMAQNLDYDVPGNDTDVCYDNDPANCTKYGRLYNWSTAMNVCPANWHLPSEAEWVTLTSFVGINPGTKLKAVSGWNDYKGSSGNGTDDYGFSALPGGSYSFGNFDYVGDNGWWWTATEAGTSYALKRGFNYSYTGVDDSRNGGDKAYLYSVRCIMHAQPEGTKNDE